MAPAGIGHKVEGVHAVIAALETGRIDRILIERRRRDILSDLIDLAKTQGAGVEWTDDVRDQAQTQAPQGVIAFGSPIALIDLDEAAALSAPAALVVLDHVVDPQNVGAIARSAAATGIGAIVSAERRSAPFGPAAFKAAAGALERVRVCSVSSIAEAVTRLGKIGVWSVGLTADGEASMFGLELLDAPVALVLGEEGKGISRLVAERVDVRARLPMHQGIESLNVSVAAALSMFELARIRGTLS